jgi:hypothetical protein
MMPIVATISTENPVIRDLAAGRYRVSMVLSDGRMGDCQLVTTAGRLEFTTRDFSSDQIVTHRGGPVVLWTSPHIPGRRPPSVSLQLNQEM